MGSIIGIPCRHQESCVCGVNQVEEKTRAVSCNVSPEKTIQFSLSNDTSSTSTFLTLGHSGDTTDPIAFKIKVNQPRRYIVRPSHGLIVPGSSVSIMITLVKKEQSLILETHNLLGSGMQSTWSNHKFLIQSCAVPQQHLPNTYHDVGKDDLIDWKSVWNGEYSTVSYRTLDVEHLVVDKSKPSSRRPIQDMAPKEIATELEGLRDKFDNLKDLHIDLLAERNLLHNKLAAAKPLPAVASEAPQNGDKQNVNEGECRTPVRELL